MTISAGDRIPEISLTTMTNEGPTPVSFTDLFEGKRVALFAVPGAFTPTSSQEHLPGFVNQAHQLTDKGIDTVACISVNDVFVMDLTKDLTVNSSSKLADCLYSILQALTIIKAP